MKKIVILFILPCLFWAMCKSKKEKNPDKAKPALTEIINQSLDLCAKQYSLMMQALPDSVFPKTTKPDGEFETCRSSWWVSGFYPGALWYLFEHTGDEKFKQEAVKRMKYLEREKFNKYTHDLGFMLYCSFGNAYRVTGDSLFYDVLITGAHSLASRFNPDIGCMKSWDWGGDRWQFPVIIDNMMNLEFLFWGNKATKDSSFYKICVSHADKTLKNHFRKDFSSYHLVDYDTINGDVIKKQTVQGAADESAWARGQAWGLYGYTVMYRETRDKKYLDHARKIAEFILNHPNLPDDYIPYWDFNAPNIPDDRRDASAAAVIASALIELSDYVEEQYSSKFLAAAEKMIISLSSEQYLAKEGSNNNFILMHSVGNIPENSEVDVPLTYADYYFIEALMRLKNKE